MHPTALQARSNGLDLSGRKGNWLFISGLTATDERGTLVGKGNIVAQTHQIFEKMKAILDAAGAVSMISSKQSIIL
jgi:enamine deaminase RidA (YjgF/YER057c/UK114 family)